MHWTLLLMILTSGSPTGIPDASAPPITLGGAWNLTWQTRHGPVREGRFVVVQSGTAISAEIESHGRVKVAGTILGSDFTLRGTKLMVPYTISGHIQNGAIEGTLNVLSVARHFIGVRSADGR